MKEICGYKDLNGKFHEKKEDCELADIEIKVKKISNQLDNFHYFLNDRLFRDKLRPYLNKYTSYSQESYAVNAISELVAKQVLMNSNMFLEVLKEKENLKKELDFLYEEYKNKKRFKWWLQFKWW